MITPSLRLALLLTGLLSAAALGTALASEHWGGLVPCALCLVERWPWWVAIGVAALGVLLPRPAIGWLLVLALLAAAAGGFVHAGVEWGWWPSPLPACAAPDFSGLSIAERLARMPATPAKPCDEPAYLIPGLPVSMAEMNLLAGLALAAGLAMFLSRSRRTTP